MGRVLFLVHELVRGGAERQLVALAKGLRDRGHDVTVCTYRQGGAFEKDLAGSFVRLVCIPKSTVKVLGTMVFLPRLLRLIRSLRPDVIHGYMDTGNMPAALLKPLTNGARIVFGLRSSELDMRIYDRYAHVLTRLMVRLSRYADLVIANSRSGAAYAVSIGYPADRTIAIPNGIDTQRFAPDAAGRARVRQEVGFTAEDKVIGIVARLDPMKGHSVFVAAARLLASRRPEVRFLCVGDWTEPFRSGVLAELNDAGLGERLKWIGYRDDMPAVYSALDIGTSASLFGEGFSNAIAECMACGVPCAVTRVGDSAAIVGDLSIAVPPGDAPALADAWETMLPRLGPALSRACREKVAAEYSVDALVRATEQALWPPSSSNG